MISASLPSLIQSFFTDRLLAQRQASMHTVSSYRDCFRLLLHFAAQHVGKAPCDLMFENIDAPLVGRFLDHIEAERGNSIRTRNARLAAIHSFFRYAAFREPAYLLHCRRVLAIPSKRCRSGPVGFLDRSEIESLLAAPDTSSWTGRRDRALLLLAVQTGLRVSELISLRSQDVALGAGAHVRCEGKGRKQRCTPLRKDAVKVLASWLRERKGQPTDPLFPSARGDNLSRDAVERLVAKHAIKAGEKCSSLVNKKVTPHTLRHSAAMELLQNGVDHCVIALWLGHESVETTQIYIHANLKMKEKAIEKTTPLNVKPGRYRPEDKLLAFLESL